MLSRDARISCYLDSDDDTGRVTLVVSLSSEPEGTPITTLEYADITEEFDDFVEVNNHYDLYKDTEKLKRDIEYAHLTRFMGSPRDIPKLDLITNLRMKMRHQAGNCKDSCILCNPDIGDDPFPDFMFKIKNLEPEGEA